MDPTIAALIGAAVASLVSIGAQFLGHELSLRRDLKSDRRQRLSDAVVKAATLLQPMVGEERLSQEEWDAIPEPHPKSFGALVGKAAHDAEAHQIRASEGLTLLEVQFGGDHQLIVEYREASYLTWKAELANSDYVRDPEEQSRINQIPALHAKRQKAADARNAWTARALREVEQI